MTKEQLPQALLQQLLKRKACYQVYSVCTQLNIVYVYMTPLSFKNSETYEHIERHFFIAMNMSSDV